MLKDLKERSRYVVTRRYGLDEPEKETLESIGRKYGITRERVRQIENFAIQAIRKSESYQELEHIFEELRDIMHDLGGIVHEDEFLDYLADDDVTRNHLHLYLVLGEHFDAHKENSHFEKRWVSDRHIAQVVHEILEDLHMSVDKHDLLTEAEVLQRVLSHTRIEDVRDEYQDDDIAKRWLRLSKALAQNPLGEWGHAQSPNVRTRGIRDLAYLVMRRNGGPMHFREVADAISETFGRSAHIATTHNELIKDSRFVLVGRGMYALKEWGYKPGVVRDVIREILEKESPLTKEEIIERVLRERYLKRNTILVNLQNQKYFTKDSKGRYALAEQDSEE